MRAVDGQVTRLSFFSSRSEKPGKIALFQWRGGHFWSSLNGRDKRKDMQRWETLKSHSNENSWQQKGIQLC